MCVCVSETPFTCHGVESSAVTLRVNLAEVPRDGKRKKATIFSHVTHKKNAC